MIPISFPAYQKQKVERRRIYWACLIRLTHDIESLLYFTASSKRAEYYFILTIRYYKVNVTAVIFQEPKHA